MRRLLARLISPFYAIPAKRRWFYFAALAVVLAFAAWAWLDKPEQPQRPTISMTQLIQDGRAGDIRSVLFRGSQLIATYADEHRETAIGSLPEPVFLEFVEQGIELKSEAAGNMADLVRTITMFILIAISCTILYVMLRGSGNRFAMGGKVRLIRPGEIKITFADVAGQPEAKIDLEEIVEALRYPAKFKRLGANPPKGILMSGPPGVGKTLLGRAIAGEAHAHMIVASGSNFRETYMGQGSRKVRQMFEMARKYAPTIIFIDEVEVMGRRRGNGGSSSIGSEEDSTLNTLLVELDGFNQDEGIVLICATNRPDMIDEALKRPGRLDRHVVLDYPDLAGRRAILRIHAQNRPFAAEVDLDKVAERMTGMSGAALANLMNEAAICAAKRDASEITLKDIDQAFLNGLLGRAKEGTALSDEDRNVVAVHEAGHALVAARYPGAQRPKQATIIPRGKSLGAVIPESASDRRLLSIKSVKASIAVALAGRAAETVVFGRDQITTGASDDFRQATSIAIRMAGEWNMGSDVPGLYPVQGLSQAAVTKMEDRAQEIIAEIWTEVVAMIEAEITKLDAIAWRLKEQETVSGEEIQAIAEGRDPWQAAA